MQPKMMAKTTTAACLKCSCAQQRLLENYLKVHSCARDHSCTQTKLHVDPCRDSQDYPVTKNADGQTDGFSALYSRLVLYFTCVKRLFTYLFCSTLEQIATCMLICTCGRHTTPINNQLLSLFLFSKLSIYLFYIGKVSEVGESNQQTIHPYFNVD